MQAIRVHHFGGLDSLVAEDVRSAGFRRRRGVAARESSRRRAEET
jgi:hypothetical protein